MCICLHYKAFGILNRAGRSMLNQQIKLSVTLKIPNAVETPSRMVRWAANLFSVSSAPYAGMTDDRNEMMGTMVHQYSSLQLQWGQERESCR